MNLPNKLTIARVAMVPLFMLALHGPGFGWYDMYTARLIAVGIFAVASLTDWLDGYLARRLDLITNFGKFMDPLADKILVMAALAYMVWLDDIAPWVLIVIQAREFAIAGLRMLAAQKNNVIAAGFWGKAKTVSQMAMIMFILPGFAERSNGVILGQILIYSCVALTIISAIDYIYHNKKAFIDI